VDTGGVGVNPAPGQGSPVAVQDNHGGTPQAATDGAGKRWSTSRTEAFSDGVFAIAITLLVLDLRVPESDLADLWGGILREWPAYLGYVTSFLTIGGIWLAHHAMFRRMRFANVSVMRLNLLLLMTVAFLPFPTRLLTEALSNNDAERAAVIFYGMSLLVISLLLAATWGAVARDRALLRPDVSAREVDAIARTVAPNIGLYVVAGVIAIVAPVVAAWGYLLIAIVLVMRAHADES
jgi:uncharacterized membrane protein